MLGTPGELADPKLDHVIGLAFESCGNMIRSAGILRAQGFYFLTFDMNIQSMGHLCSYLL